MLVSSLCSCFGFFFLFSSMKKLMNFQDERLGWMSFFPEVAALRFWPPAFLAGLTGALSHPAGARESSGCFQGGEVLRVGCCSSRTTHLAHTEILSCLLLSRKGGHQDEWSQQTPRGHVLWAGRESVTSKHWWMEEPNTQVSPCQPPQTF